LDERVRDRIVAETRGIPLALLELPRGLSPAELELGFGSHDSTAMANRIEQGFLRQLQQLPVDTRRLLLAAAVEPLGDVTLLWRAAGYLDIDLRAAEPAEEAGLVSFAGRVTFRHPLVRSAIYRTAGVTDVRGVHRALAEATDPVVDPDRRAWHRAFAASGPDEGVAQELEQAAQHLMARGALVTGAAFLARATELTADPSQRASRALVATVNKIFAGEFESAAELLAIAELCPLDTIQEAYYLWLRASVVRALNRAPARDVPFLDAAKLLHPVDAASAREAYLNAVGTQIMAGRIDDQHYLRDMATAARSAPPPPEPARPIDHVLDAFAVRCTDGYEPSLPISRRALAACLEEPEHNGQFLQWLWFASLLAPDIWDDVMWDRVTAHVVQLNRDAGAYSTLPISLEYRAEFELATGNLDVAAAMLDEADTIVGLIGRPPVTHTAPELAAWRGDEARGRSAIDNAVDVMVAGFTGRIIGLGEHARAILFNGLGRYEDALAAAKRGSEQDDIGVLGRTLVERIEAGARCGASHDAAVALAQLEALTLAAGTDWALGMLARSRALLRDDDGAESLYHEAIERLAATRMQAHLARTHLVYGEWLRRAQRRVDAREQLRRAHDMLDAMGAVAFAARARRELEATGETVRKRSVETTDALTPQEAQIARLAADGATNPEIGSRLFISPRTVEYHLTKIFVKLGIKSRRELRDALS
jgi:DNA-binding CsgD family transcriptional regulator